MSSLFSRLNDILNANINDLLDKIEDPERMIKQAIREMEENIAQAKEGVISAIASEKQLSKELESQRRQAQQWLDKAQSALQSEREDLAREALARKKEIDAIIKNLEPAWESAKATSDRLRGQLRQLENKLEEAKRKRSTLIARQRAAQAREHMDGSLERFVETGLDAETKFDRMAGKIDELEARNAARAELNEEQSPLEKELLDLENEREIDAELAALKKKMQGD